MLRAFLTAVVLAAPSAGSAAITPSMPSPNWPAPADRGDPLLRATALRLHNGARAQFGVAPVRWSALLEADARKHASFMAATGVYAHDMSAGRRAKSGENMWRGQRGVFSYEVMLGLMVDEVRLFRPGVFPAVSASGEWHDVGHYTQIVWPSTTEIGCAVAVGPSMDYLVCRYSPKGNQDGVFLSPIKQLAERGD